MNPEAVPDPSRRSFSAWNGWVYFAAAMMMLSGIFSVTWGLVAIVRDEVFVSGPNGNVIDLDYTTWGWIHLIGGVFVVIAGGALLTGAFWAVVVAVLLAMFSAVGNLLVLPAFPVWSTIAIAIDIFVIYALTVHNDLLGTDT